MKKLTGLLALTGLLGSVAMAQSIQAVKVSGDVTKITPSSKAWRAVKLNEVTLYPQTTIKLNDKKANELNADRKAFNAKVGALYDGKNIAIKIVWPDSTKNTQNSSDSDSYADGFAMQFANSVSNVNELPYIGMGSKGRDVTVVLQKAVEATYEPDGKGDVSLQVNGRNTNYFNKELEIFHKQVDSLSNTDYQRAFVAEGFRSMTEIKDGSMKFNSVMTHKKGKWSGVVTKTMVDSYTKLDSKAFPVVFAVWDGDKNNRDGLKMLSSWVSVNLVKGETELSKVTNEVVKGDIAKGKQVAMDNCAACHHFEDATFAPANMAPNLENIGGYATASYLRESIDKPSAVVVPGYNRNSHPAYEWYTLGENGERTSTMPAYDWLSAEDKTNLVAYLQTLKAESK
jgi:complex iron-sulfur molybdoenzyme family reductase subunit gamma